MLYETLGSGLFVVRYRGSADMAPGSQQGLIDAIRSAARAQPVGIVFVIDDCVLKVDFSVPSFWLRVAADPAVRIAAMAMVTRSLAVEIAARGFGAAVRFRTAPIEIRALEDEPSAVAWVRRLPSQAAAATHA
ncbi:MAG: hypothetical protein WCC48_14035 [Anaeromyxobacteraceae bacterium]